FVYENFVIAQSKGAEAAGDPAQAFSCWMRLGGMRISRAHNLTQQNERWVGELVFFHDRIERDVFAVMTELAIRNIEHKSVSDFCPVSARGRKINSASRSMNFLMSHGQATRSTLIFSRVIHFIR